MREQSGVMASKIRSRGGFPTALCLLVAAFFVSGCSSYRLQGRVIEGARPSVELVSKDDPRLSQEIGVPEADLKLTLDPDRLSREVVGWGSSGSDGTFSLGVDAFGSGVLMHEVEIDARRDGFLDTQGAFMLPGKASSRRVLVTVVAGKQRRVDERSFLDRTMDEAEVYLRE